MPRVTVNQTINIYEVRGVEVSLTSILYLHIDSHWDRNNMVGLTIGEDGTPITVCGEDLITAIKNAMNTGGI